MQVTWERLERIFGSPSPPHLVSELQFDGLNAEVRALVALPWETIQASDLWVYIHDLASARLDAKVFYRLFPVCIKFWCDSLLRGLPASVGDADLHAALVRGEALAILADQGFEERVFELFVDGFVERLEMQVLTASAPSPWATAWLARFNSIGFCLPIIPAIWDRWWNSSSYGAVSAALLYISLFVYPDGVKNVCGLDCGIEALADNDSLLRGIPWQRANRRHISEALSVDRFVHKITEARRLVAFSQEIEILDALARAMDHRAGIVAEIIEAYVEERLVE